MGIWSQIKYALNSTVGTNHFRPLDKILTRELAPSDDNYINLCGTYGLAQGGTSTIVTVNKGVEFITSGTVTVITNTDSGNEFYPYDLDLLYEIVHNGVAKQVTRRVSRGEGDAVAKDSFDVAVDIGDTIKLISYDNPNTDYTNYGRVVSAYIGATEIPPKLAKSL